MVFSQPLNRLADAILELPVIGLDISDRSVKFLRFERSRGSLRVAAFGSAPIESGVMAGGEIKDSAKLSLVLKDLNTGGRRLFGDRFVVAALPEEKSFLRIVQVPRVRVDQLANKIRWELESNIPLPIEDVYFGYEIIRDSEEKQDHFDVLTVAFPRVIVESYIHALTGAGMVPLALELESQAIARTVVSSATLGEPVVIVDMGARRTSFVLMGGGSIALTSTVMISGDSMDREIEKTLGVSAAEASKLKNLYGLRDSAYGGKISAALTPLLETLSGEIEKHIEFYHDHLRNKHGSPPDVLRIVCTGGEANLLGLDAYLSRALKRPVEISDPFLIVRRSMKRAVPPIARRHALEYSTAIGLALREFDL